MSIIVLGSKRADDCETLFVNLLENGVELARPGELSGTSRLLPLPAVEQAVEIVTAWHAGTRDGFPTFAKSVSKAQLKETGLLTPWTYAQR